MAAMVSDHVPAFGKLIWSAPDPRNGTMRYAYLARESDKFVSLVTRGEFYATADEIMAIAIAATA